MESMQKHMKSMDERLSNLEQDVSTIKEDVEIIKEDAQVTRTATNTLLDWAEQAEVQIKIPLYRKAE